MKNILTFDVEDWYHPNLADLEKLQDRKIEDRVLEPTLRILNMLDETQNRATFFVLGEVAEKFPELVKEIAYRGHEVASHGYCHNLVYNYTKSHFETDINQAIELLQTIINRKILGYRAPSWSLDKQNTPWAWEVLKAAGFVYDSSVYPYKTFLYGDMDAPRIPYDIVLEGKQFLKEMPPSVVEIFGKRVPFSGGFFFRMVPYRFIKWGIRQHNRAGYSAVIYLHPWEIDVEQPRLPVGVKKRFILYANISRTERKLRRLMNEFQFTTIQNYFGFEAQEPSPQKKSLSSNQVV